MSHVPFPHCVKGQSTGQFECVSPVSQSPLLLHTVTGLFTIKFISSDIFVFPAPSVAFALIKCVAFETVVVSQENS